MPAGRKRARAEAESPGASARAEAESPRASPRARSQVEAIGAALAERGGLRVPRAAPEQYVSAELRLLPPHDRGALSPAARRRACEQARAVLRAQDPLLEPLLNVRAITTRREGGLLLENFINLRFAAEYCTMVHHERAGRTAAEAVLFCFMASSQLEPVVVVVAVHPERGRLVQLTATQLEQLDVALQQFKVRFSLEGEGYAYTRLAERMQSSVHSQHFHVKIRIPTEMYLQVFPAMQVLGHRRHLLEPFKRMWEPLAHKFERQATAPWADVRRAAQADGCE